MHQDFPYQPFYCEENIWHLAKKLNEEDAEVWFAINQNQTVATAQQKAVEANTVVIWDYHVIYYSPEDGIYDFDTRCSFPCPKEEYLQASFPNTFSLLPKEYAAYFRVIPVADYLRNFSSTREHMLDATGCYLQQPPDWPRIGEGHKLGELINYENRTHGTIYSFEELLNIC